MNEIEDTFELEDGLTYEEFDDREARERYPWLYADESESELPGQSGDNRTMISEKGREGHKKLLAKLFAEQHFLGANGTNYHHLFELTDEHLPELAFRRINNLFDARTANRYLETPVGSLQMRRLFGDLWREGELVLLFADTGAGKSALAVQIASALAGGEPIAPFELEAEPQRVLYFDFELTDEQFAARYRDPNTPAGADDRDGGSSLFPVQFIRCTPRRIWEIPEEFEDVQEFVFHSIVDTIEYVGAKAIILDNLTWLSASTHNAVAAQRLMRMLLALKRDRDLSILVLAHTPKMRGGLPLDLNHLQGSKMLANFADNVIAMGKSSRSANLRYLKPIKQRNAAPSFDENTVPVMRLAKDGRMLKFSFVGHEPEADHLENSPQGAEAERRERKIRAAELANAGDTIREIAEKLCIGRSTVGRYLKDEKEEEAIK